MTTLSCPKCRQHMPDDALDRGQCPACGFPLDGPLVLDPVARRPRTALFAVGGAILVTAGAAAFSAFGDGFGAASTPAPDVASIAPAAVEPVGRIDPPPRPAKSGPPEVGAPFANPPAPDPKTGGPRAIGVVMKVDPRVAATRHFDHPDDTAALPDLNSGARVVLTGRVRALRIGSVHGGASIDASGLVAEEVVITGDLNGDAVVTLNAPSGKVTIGGYVVGNAKLTVAAPGGEVVLASSGRVTGNSVVAVTAKRVEAAGTVTGNARLHATLTAGGSLRLSTVEEGATVTYKKAAASDPPLAVEKGAVRGGAKVFAE